MAYLVIAIFCGLAAAIIGKIKGSSFFLWFVVGAVLPLIGIVAAILYRYERFERRRRCAECNAVVPVTNQVCTRCGADLEYPVEQLIPR